MVSESLQVSVYGIMADALLVSIYDISLHHTVHSLEMIYPSSFRWSFSLVLLFNKSILMNICLYVARFRCVEHVPFLLISSFLCISLDLLDMTELVPLGA